MIDRKAFFDGIRSGPFPKKLLKGQVQGIEIILDEWERRGLIDLRWLAYMLATVFWETAQTMQPITEYGSQRYLRGKRYWPYIGRGFVQLTWRDNYRRMTEILGREFLGGDLVEKPDLALVPKNAAAIMFEGMLRAESFKGDFTGKSLEDYFTATTTDWVNARRIINRLDKANEIAAIAKQFYADLLASNK
jgi:putative chitinase